MSLELAFAHDVVMPDPAVIVCTAWEEAWTLPPPLNVSEWADQHRMIARGAGAEPGQWVTDRHPPLREIMDSLSDHSPVRVVDFMKSAQIGATEIGINWVGYVIDRGLDSMIVCQPVKDLARAWATTKFDPAIIDMPALQAKIETDNTLEKRYAGGTLWAIWANSSKQLRQRTARYIFADEVDDYPRNLNGQGPAEQQLEARAMSYGERGKIYRACTPTVAGFSAIESSFEEGDQRHYHVHCPHCGGEQVLEIERLQPNGTFACAVNGCMIEEHHKTTMFRERGHGGTAYWKPTNPKAPAWHRSYHLWAAYAPLGLGLSWKAIAERREDAERNTDKAAGFNNLVLGRTYAGERREQKWEDVQALAEPGVHRGIVPAWALVLTAGVDVQHDRFEVQIIGTGRGQRRAVIDYAVIDGNPTLPEEYAELDEFLKGTWTTTSGTQMPITAVAIDGGNWTEMVAQFVKKHVSQSGGKRHVKTDKGYFQQTIYLVRGRAEKNSARAVYRPAKTEVNQRDKTVARSVGVWGVGTSVLKQMIFGWLNAAVAAREEADQQGTPEDIEARMLRFPGGTGEKYDPIKPDPGQLPDEYYKGLTVEHFDLESGYWITPKGARNEPFDTAVYAVWASLAPAVKADVMRDSQWKLLETIYHPAAKDLFDAVDSRETPPEPAGRPAIPVPKDSRGTHLRPQRRGALVDPT